MQPLRIFIIFLFLVFRIWILVDFVALFFGTPAAGFFSTEFIQAFLFT